MLAATRLFRSTLALVGFALLAAPITLAQPSARDDASGVLASARPDGEIDDFNRKVNVWKERLDKQYGEGFWTYFYDDGVMPRPYLVAAQASRGADPDSLEESYSKIFSNLYRIFFEEYGDLLDLDPVTDPVPVLVFDSKEAYEKVREEKPELGLSDPEFIAGYYRPWTTELIQWRQLNLREVMFHEGSHQLVDFCARKFNTMQTTQSPWFQEGIAEYLGGHKYRSVYSEEEDRIVETFTLGQFLQGRYTAAQQGMKSGDALSIKELTHLDFPKFIQIRDAQSGNSRNQVITGLVYAQGWALVMFLHQYNDGLYRPLFDEYFNLEIRGEGGGDAFGNIFLLETDEDWKLLDEEFREYVFTDLRRMRYQK